MDEGIRGLRGERDGEPEEFSSERKSTASDQSVTSTTGTGGFPVCTLLGSSFALILIYFFLRPPQFFPIHLSFVANPSPTATAEMFSAARQRQEGARYKRGRKSFGTRTSLYEIRALSEQVSPLVLFFFSHFFLLALLQLSPSLVRAFLPWRVHG